MKTRIHIHRENIDAIGEIRHFTIKLPPDTGRVISFKATATPKPDRPNKNHAETGWLQMKREGVLLYELPVWYEGVEPNISPIKAPGRIESMTQTYVSGGRTGFISLSVPGYATVIFCKYENGGMLYNYVLALYFIYEPKQIK